MMMTRVMAGWNMIGRMKRNEVSWSVHVVQKECDHAKSGMSGLHVGVVWCVWVRWRWRSV